MRTADAVIESLIRHGIDTLYALPGVHNDHLFDAAFRAQDRFRVLHPRHEQTAAYMALGAALVTGKPQAFAVVPGPGLLNASAALLTAYGMGAPVIALAGQIPSFAIDRGHGHLHEIHDQLGLLRHITKHAARIRAPHEAPALVADAVRIACSGRQRPVALECAIDTWGAAGAVEFPDITAPTVPPVDADAVTRAAKLLGHAERPLIVVGGGALDAGPEVRAIAEALAAPVSSFRRGRGVIPTTHPLAVSFTEGHALWQHADAVLAIGTRLYQQQSVWGVDETLPIVRLDIDPAEIDRFRRPACALVGDAATVLRALLAELPAHNQARRARRGAGHDPRRVRGTTGATGTVDGFSARDPGGFAGRRHLCGGGDAGRLRQPPRVHRACTAHVPLARVSGHAGVGLWHRARRTGRCAGTQGCAGDRRRRLHVPGGGARDGDATRAAGGGRLCSTMARSAMCGGFRSSNTATD